MSFVVCRILACLWTNTGCTKAAFGNLPIIRDKTFNSFHTNKNRIAREPHKDFCNSSLPHEKLQTVPARYKTLTSTSGNKIVIRIHVHLIMTDKDGLCPSFVCVRCDNKLTLIIN